MVNGKELTNFITHCIGVAFGIAALIALLVKSAPDPYKVVGVLIYGISLICLYVASSLYHVFKAFRDSAPLAQKFDHIAIYCLIAGTYTPICLTLLRGVWGWSLLIAIWSLAIFGIVFKAVFFEKIKWLNYGLYLVMGWLVVIAFYPLIKAVPLNGIYWMIAGGLCYTVGAVIMYADRPKRTFFSVWSAHQFWHLLVLAGSACHFTFILEYLL